MSFKIVTPEGKKVNTNNFPTRKKAQAWISKNEWVKGFSSIHIVPVKKR